MNVHAVSYRDCGAGIRFVMVVMPVFKHDIALGIMNMPSVGSYDWRKRYVQALMNMSVLNGSVCHGAVGVFGDEAGHEAVFINSQSMHTCLYRL